LAKCVNTVICKRNIKKELMNKIFKKEKKKEINPIKNLNNYSAP